MNFEIEISSTSYFVESRRDSFLLVKVFFCKEKLEGTTFMAWDRDP